MTFTLKLTKMQSDAISSIMDIYNAEVSRGEWQPDLFWVSAKNFGTKQRSDVLTITSSDGAELFIENAMGEIDHCREVMHGIYREPEEYPQAYRIQRRIKRIIAAVAEAFPEVAEKFGYGLTDYLPKK